VEKDFSLAAAWWRKAAAQGDTQAQLNLSGSYSKGEGVAKDIVEAYAYWNLSGKNANLLAMIVLFIGEKTMSAEQANAVQQRTKELQDEIRANLAAKNAGK
jgi:TPR repeat protein